MVDFIAPLCILGALIFLVILSIIDFKTRLLPNKYVASFAILGIIFHLTLAPTLASLTHMGLGGLAGFMSLFIIRMIANKIYNQDALGLGDVKLMGAGGLWLGLSGIMMAMWAGALVSVIHGLIAAFYISRKTGDKMNLAQLQIPAGPGFAVGIVIAGIIQFMAAG